MDLAATADPAGKSAPGQRIGSGGRPVDLYRRIFAGVNGTPMPQAGADANNPSGLTPEEIWHIVAYVRSLPYDKMSEPGVGKGKLAGLNAWHE